MQSAIGYIRVSTARQGRSGLGLEAQQTAIAKFAEAEAFKLTETFTETESGADDSRPQLNAAMVAPHRPGLPASRGGLSGVAQRPAHRPPPQAPRNELLHPPTARRRVTHLCQSL